MPADGWEVSSHSVQETQRLGARLGRLLGPGDVLLLQGGLGAGKTVFAQGVARGLGIQEPVTSPTFTLIREYEGALRLYHVDLYRLGGDVDAAGIGLEDYLYGEGVTLVEWAERAPGIIPAAHLQVAILATGERERAIAMIPSGERYEALLAALNKGAAGRAAAPRRANRPA